MIENLNSFLAQIDKSPDGGKKDSPVSIKYLKRKKLLEMAQVKRNKKEGEQRQEEKPILEKLIGKQFPKIEYTKHSEEGVDVARVRLWNRKETLNSYLTKLANTLKTPQKISQFLDIKMKYTPDIDRSGKKTDDWQLAYETLKRQEGGKMLGDCDDYAFLAKELLSRIHDPSPISAHVMGIPGHAICIWLEKNKYGNYDAYTIGTFGFDKNGFNSREGRRDPSRNRECPINHHGFSTMEEAINSVMKKYDNSGKGIKKPRRYRVEQKGNIKLLENTSNTFGASDGVEGKSGRHIYDDMPLGLLLADHKDPDYKRAREEAKKTPEGKKYLQKQMGTLMVSNMPNRPT